MKLHVGCGECVLPGWVNVDIEPMPGVDIQDDIRRLDKITDDSCDIIYACHSLEHVGRHEVEDVLRLWGRKLKPGATLRLSVPNFDAIASYYAKHKAIDPIEELVMGGQRTSYDYHSMIFDEALLTDYLERAGFANIRPWNPHETDHAQSEDHSQFELDGVPMSLNLEATRP